MSTRALVLLLIPLILAALALSYMANPLVREPASDTVSSGIIYDPDVEALVENFGESMKNVSLLVSEELLHSEMQSSYGAYVAPELLATWQEDPESAPGRLTSSPWPDRIQIGSMEGDGNVFVVHGTVVDVVSAEEGGEDIVGTYPVELRVEKRADGWMITDYKKGLYSQLPTRATIVGTFTCLPHRETTGPQTMECAYGVQEDESGDHYAVNTMLMSSMNWQNIAMGVRVRIEGVMVPAESLSTDMWQKYDIVGIISATTIQEL